MGPAVFLGFCLDGIVILWGQENGGEMQCVGKMQGLGMVFENLWNIPKEMSVSRWSIRVQTSEEVVQAAFKTGE